MYILVQDLLKQDKHTTIVDSKKDGEKGGSCRFSKKEKLKHAWLKQKN